MGKEDLLIVGLGNPGDRYRSTRHNVGFLLVDQMAIRWNVSFSQKKWHSQFISLLVEGRLVSLIKPLTFMNLSGEAIAPLVRFFKIQPDQLLVIHDDLDMPPARIKLVKGGGSGGHNGIKSIVDSLGTGEFYRLKIGIGRPGHGGVHPDFPVDRYVLGDMTDEDFTVLQSRYDSLEEGIRVFLRDNPARAMTFLNTLK